MTRNWSLLLVACLSFGVSLRADDFQEKLDKAGKAALTADTPGTKPVPAAPAQKASWQVPFDANFPGALKQQTIGDFDFMEGLRGPKVSPLHQSLFGPMQGASYRRFFLDRVKSIGAKSCGPLGALACVSPYKDPTKMWIAPGYTSLNLPQIYRVSVLYHESRHTEVAHGFWLHSKCPDPFLDDKGQDIKGIFSGTKLAGMPACDKTSEGAYAVGLVLMKNIGSNCSNCTGKVKMDADFYADDTIKRIVGAQPVKTLRDDLYQ